MKPTASQLAKQNQERLIEPGFQKSGNSSVNAEGQAAKRQKVEGGLLCKVTDTKNKLNLYIRHQKGNVLWMEISCISVFLDHLNLQQFKRHKGHKKAERRYWKRACGVKMSCCC